MTRAIAIITCFIAAMFLISIQGECSEICEYEPETEIECCAVSYTKTQSEQTGTNTKRIDRTDLGISYPPVSVINHTPSGIPPVRILHCVFRE